jgi:guanylate kinase
VGLLLYGPPAAGKDTITAALTRLDPHYELFRKLKVGAGRTEGYRVITATELDAAGVGGGLLYRNGRYGNEYAVDRHEVEAMVARGAVPIVHLGQVQGVEAVRSYSATRWCAVALWCSRAVTAVRLQHRGSDDLAARLRAWDESADDLLSRPDAIFDLTIHTDSCAPDRAAALIDAAVRASG